jgi:hypothetical protein
MAPQKSRSRTCGALELVEILTDRHIADGHVELGAARQLAEDVDVIGDRNRLQAACLWVHPLLDLRSHTHTTAASSQQSAASSQQQPADSSHLV